MRPLRVLRIALKSRVMEKSDGPIEAPAESLPKADPATSALHRAHEKQAAPKKRKRLLAPREEILWYPTIKPELCNGCGDCKVLCKPGVFEPGEPDPAGIHRPKLIVARPYNCLVLCNRCVPICTSGAIILPPKEEFEKFVEYLD